MRDCPGDTRRYSWRAGIVNATQYLFGFEGRTNRAKWWLLIPIMFGAAIVYYYALFMVLSTAALSAVSSSSMSQVTSSISGSAILFLLISLAYFIGTFWVWLAVTVKRLHDRDKSGVWIWLFAIGPWAAYILSFALVFTHSGFLSGLFALAGLGITVWYIVELGCLRGTIGENRFGPDPLMVYLAYGVPAQAYAAPGGWPTNSGASPNNWSPPPSGNQQAARPGESASPGTLELSGVGDFSEYFLKVDSIELGGMGQGLAVGRDAGQCMFAVEGSSVSRIHARLSVRDGQFSVQDTASTNGTKLNGRSLGPGEVANLRSGDRVAFGEALFNVKIG